MDKNYNYMNEEKQIMHHAIIIHIITIYGYIDITSLETRKQVMPKWSAVQL